jgi:hypothetical protein
LGFLIRNVLNPEKLPTLAAGKAVDKVEWNAWNRLICWHTVYWLFFNTEHFRKKNRKIN